MRLAVFILANLEPILAEWEVFAQSIWPGGATITPKVLRNDAENVLVAAAVDMRSAQTTVQQDDKSKGKGDHSVHGDRMDRASIAHGRDRHDWGFDLPAVLSEYRALRASVVRLWRESRPIPDAEDLRDLIRFHESMDQSLTQAVIEFTTIVERERQAALDKELTLGEKLREINQALMVSDVRQHELAEQAQHSQREAEKSKDQVWRGAELLRFIIDRSPTGFYIVDGDFRISHINADSQARGFRNVNPAIGRRLDDAVRVMWPEPLASEIIAIFQHTLDTGESYRSPGLESRRADLDATETYEWQLERIIMPDGRYAVVCYYYDTTSLHEAEHALRESEERFRVLADNMSQLAWTCEQLGEATWYNKRWLDYTGLTFEEMKGEGWKRCQHPDHVERVAAGVQRALESGKPWEDTFPLRGEFGQYRWFLSRAVPIRDEDGKIVRWFGTNTDITERILMQERITEQSEQIAGESRRKDEFLAMLSHELRNPLAPIRSAVHLLRTQERAGAGGGNENPIQKQAHEIIERQVASLTKMIGDLLEVSRLTTGRIRLNLQVVDMNQVVTHAVQTVTPLIEQHKHELVMNLCPDGVWCNADPARLEEVFVNLLNNAAKYTHDGGRIEIWCETPRGSNHAQFRVRDNGMGIDKELLPRIFDLFTQADRSLARSSGGLGIGLSLAHRLIDLHGGSIEARSDGPDKGAEFIVKLALVEAPPVPEHQAPEQPSAAWANGSRPEDMRVLIVDDNLDLVTMLASTLRPKGYVVQSAYTGPDGLKIAHQWRPDVILLDIGLPGLDGYEVARQIRSAEELDLRQARLIALTGYGRDTDIDLAREAGFDAHLVKPYEFRELEKLMNSPRNMQPK